MIAPRAVAWPTPSWRASPRIVVVGEGMIEIGGEIDGAARITTGGDTLNIAVALARLGHAPAYLTALGTDDWSVMLERRWAAEGIDLSLIAHHPDRVAGLYAVRTDDRGERHFTYWRSMSAARALFDLPDADRLIEQAGQADLLILSGITLSLFDAAGQARLAALAAAVRARGGHVAFDGNYRVRGWPDATAARTAFATFAPHVSIALPTAEDEILLHGAMSPAAIAARWHDAGAAEVAVKLGPDGAYVSVSGGTAQLVPTERQVPVDTTGAGDAFDAGYLAARIERQAPTAAAAFANRIAAVTIGHPGAIPPREAITALGTELATALATTSTSATAGAATT